MGRVHPQSDSTAVAFWLLPVATVLVLFSSFGPWLQFPLTGSLRATELSGPLSAPLFHSQSTLLIMLCAVMITSWLFQLRWLLLACGLGILTLAGLFYLDLMANDQGWLVRFLTESEQRGALEAFLKKSYWPNTNPDPTTMLVSEFEYIWERIQAVWGAVGRGWLHAVAAGILILVAVAVGNRTYSMLALLGILSVAVFLTVTGYPLIAAELQHIRGDTHLAAGKPRAALHAYESAITTDPALAGSRPFLIKASHAYLVLLGEPSDLAAVYLAHVQQTGTPTRNLTPLLRKQLAEEHRRLERAAATPSPGESLEGAIRRQASALNSQIWKTEGLMALNADAPGEARQAFLRALTRDSGTLDAQFFLGHTELLLGMWQQAITTLTKAFALVKHDAIRADVACTLGDALRAGERLDEARSEYDRCLTLDNIFNFRAIRSLGGT